jgi:cyclopropane fatty-acyl-phospholipid synthase-like methyltransferase
MLRNRQRGLIARLRRARDAFRADSIYGLEWGDPEVDEPLMYVKRHFLTPYVTPTTTVLEIGPGGGRWTRYLLTARMVYAVDYHQELLDELAVNFRADNLISIKNSGTDLPGVPPESIDFIFSFGVFVHLDLDLIDAYLRSFKSVLKCGGTVVLQYADKTKPLAQLNNGFAQNTPEQMRQLILAQGYTIEEEDTGTMWHSSIVRFTTR